MTDITTNTCRGCGQDFAVTAADLTAFRAADDISAQTYTDAEAIDNIDFCHPCADGGA